MSTNRRLFLQQLGAAGIVSLGVSPPAFLSRAAWAAETGENKTTGSRVLVLVQMAGGNDGLNTVIPHGDPEYYKARPGLGIPKTSVLKIDDALGLHPQMTGFKELYDEGQLAIVQGVGYPNPDRSHFRSMDIWHSARPDAEYTQDGWLGRGLDLTVEQHAGAMRAMALGTNRLPLALVGSKVNVPSVSNLAGYHLELGAGPEANRKLQRRLMGEIAERQSSAGGRGAAGDNLDFLRKTAVTAFTSADKLKEVTASYKPAAPYPTNGLGEKLKIVAQIIAGELGTRVIFVSLDGFDTHAQQAGAHQALLAELSSAVRAFFQDLKGHNLDEPRGPGHVLRIRPARERKRQPGNRSRRRVAGLCRGPLGQGGSAWQAPQPDRPGGGRPEISHRFPLGLRHAAGQSARLARRESSRRRVPRARFRVTP